MIDRIDRAIFNATDSAVLWVWNQWGIPFRGLAIFATLVADTAFFAYLSDWGRNYDTLFWVIVPILMLFDSLTMLVVKFIPATSWNRMKLSSRTTNLARTVRLIWASLLIVHGLSGEWRAAGVNAVMLAQTILLQTMMPTGPRKRREMRATNLAWSAT